MSEHNHITRGDTIGCPACDKREGRPTFIERRTVVHTAPDLSSFPEVQHRIEGGKFVCPGDESSRCHQYPDCDHELWPCGCEYVPHAECWIKPWIDALDLCDSYGGVEHGHLIRDEDFPDGDVKWSWEGDYVVFFYATAPDQSIGGGE